MLGCCLNAPYFSISDLQTAMLARPIIIKFSVSDVQCNDTAFPARLDKNQHLRVNTAEDFFNGIQYRRAEIFQMNMLQTCSNFKLVRNN